MTAPHSNDRRAGWGLLGLVAGGLLGNYFKLSLAFEIDLLFGSIAVLIAVRLYGPMWGTLAAAVAASYTVVLWNHPYAVVIFTAEAAFVGLLLRRRHRTMLVVDGAFWLFVGAPLVFLFYGATMRMGLMATATVALKQSANGIFNALVASLLLTQLPLERWLGGRTPRRTVSLNEALFNLVAALVLVPALLLMLIDSHVELQSKEEQLHREVRRVSDDIAGHVESWVRRHMHAVATLAEIAQFHGTVPGDALQRDTAMIKAAFPDFHNMYVADASGKTVAFHPPQNEKGESTLGLDFSDREYYRQLRRTRREVMSDVFPGRGGVFTPIVTFSAPVLRDGEFDGFALGALNLGHLASMLAVYERDAPRRITLVDSAGLVIASTAHDLPPHQAFHHALRGDRSDVRGNSYRWDPTDPGRPRIARWRDAYDVTESLIGPSIPWKLIVESPLAPLRDAMYVIYVRSLSLILALGFGALVLGFVVSRRMARPVERLARITSSLPVALLHETSPDWPDTGVDELRTLIRNTRSMRKELRDSFGKLRARREDLERVNRALLAEIAERQRLEQQVRQKQKMEAIGTLAGGIAHDFNNILTAILGYGELARAELAARPGTRSLVDQVIVSANRAKELVQQILTFSRRSPEARGVVRLQPLVGEAMTLLRATLPSTITIRNRCDAEVGPVVASSTQIHQILMNLCANAEAAMRETGGVLELGLEEIELGDTLPDAEPPLAPGRYVRLRVRDTGRGIEGDRLGRVFEPFYTTKEPGAGTGMGLAVVHGIVVGHGGSLAVASAPGEGATFDVYLPRAEAMLGESPADQPAGDVEHVSKGGGRILVVDDEQAIANLEKTVLEQRGYEVTTLGDGTAALEELRRAPDAYDLVITDQTMPGITGDQLVRQLQALRPDLPVILCTGYSHKIDAARARELGVAGLILKPFRAAELGRQVDRVFAELRRVP